MINEYGYVILNEKLDSKHKKNLTDTESNIMFYLEFKGFSVIPQYYATIYPDEFPIKNSKKYSRKFTINYVINDCIKLRNIQTNVIKKALKFYNKKTGGSCILELLTGFGKTFVAINMIKIFKTKTLIIVPRNNLGEQWKNEEISKLLQNVKIGIFDSHNKLDIENIDYDIIITTYISAMNISRYNEKIYKYIINNMDMIIYDELQYVGTKNNIKYILFYYNLPFKLALSATPYRTDGIDKFYQYFLGNNKIVYKTDIFKDEKKIFIHEYDNNGRYELCIKNEKPFMPETINYISQDLQRNKILVEIIEFLYEQNYNPIVICERIYQINEIYRLLCDKGLKKETFKISGNMDLKPEEEEKYRIFIGIKSKCKDGLNIKKLDSIVFGTPIKNLINLEQIFGRITRKKHNKTLIIYDIIDLFHPLFQYGWKKQRMNFYTEKNYKFAKSKILSNC